MRKLFLLILSAIVTVSLMSFEPAAIYKPKKKMKVRKGTHLFENCHGNAPCGPCPGICIRWETASILEVDDDYDLSEEDRASGFVLMYAELMNEDTQLELTFASDAKEFDGLWGIERDYTLGKSVAEVLEDADGIITLKAGRYAIDPELGAFGGVVMELK
jgi:hypothetical protein